MCILQTPLMVICEWKTYSLWIEGQQPVHLRWAPDPAQG
jgi:hypothetical protein